MKQPKSEPVDNEENCNNEGGGPGGFPPPQLASAQQRFPATTSLLIQQQQQDPAASSNSASTAENKATTTVPPPPSGAGGGVSPIAEAISTAAEAMSNRTKALLRAVQLFPNKEDVEVNSRVQLPIQEPTKFWCSIYYYEFNIRVGDVFKSEATQWQPEVQIDGYCSPSDNSRYCLGAVCNVNRSPVSTAVLQAIGKGIRIYCDSDDIFLECLGESAVFVQCPIYASMSGDNLATVYRLQASSSSASSICVFSGKHFADLIATAKTYRALYSLQTMCHLRVSFVKGWGCEYRRQTITSIPCWVEVQFPRPLQTLDRLLMEMDEPNEAIHSYT